MMGVTYTWIFSNRESDRSLSFASIGTALFLHVYMCCSTICVELSIVRQQLVLTLTGICSWSLCLCGGVAPGASWMARADDAAVPGTDDGGAVAICGNHSFNIISTWRSVLRYRSLNNETHTCIRWEERLQTHLDTRHDTRRFIMYTLLQEWDMRWLQDIGQQHSQV